MPEQTATIAVTAAPVARVEQLERALTRARGRGDELRRQRDELERISRLGDVASEASSRLRPLGRQVAECAAAPEELAEACARVAELLARLRPRRVDVDTSRAVYRQADRRAGNRDLALLHLLGSAGLRRAEACAIMIGDVD